MFCFVVSKSTMREIKGSKSRLEQGSSKGQVSVKLSFITPRSVGEEQKNP